MHRTSTGAHRLPSSRAALLRIGALVSLLAIVSFIGYRFGWFDPRHTMEHVERLRKGHSVVGFTVGLVLVYGLGTSIGMPGLPFTVISGALFGTLLGSVLSWMGGMLGAALGYWIARTVGHDVIVRWLKRYKRAEAAVGTARDFAGMLRLRLIPVLPIGTVNFVGGLAHAPFGAYMAATAIGIVPSTVIYCYFADSLLEGVGSGRSDAMRSLIIASILLILLSLAPKLLNRGESSPQVDPSDPAHAALRDPESMTR